MSGGRITRREFLKGTALAGGGLVIGWHALPAGLAEAATAKKLFKPNAFLRIGEDGTITIVVNKAEMGQGVYTSLPMLVAEELQCDWQKVKVEPSPVAEIYNHVTFGSMVTGGSTSVRTEWERLSHAGATAREMLVKAAAKQWGVKPESCRTEDGYVIHGNRRASYGKLAAAAAKLPVPKKVALKTETKPRLLGRSIPRLDSPDKINGRAVFGIDVHVPGMLTAVLARPPVFGGKLLSFKADKAKRVPGVKMVVETPRGVAVVAEGFWAAKKGRDLLELNWDEGQWGNVETEQLKKEFAARAEKRGEVARREGNVEEMLRKGARKLEALYDIPYLSHSPMEPLNCFVDLRANRCEIRVGSQAQTGDRNAAAKLTGLSHDKIDLRTTYLGGGFGRRANPMSDFVSEAVQVAMKVKKPVKVVWTREDDTRGGWYRPMWVDRLAAALDDKGNLTAWRHTLVGQSILEATDFGKHLVKGGIDNSSSEGAADLPYEIPNIEVTVHTARLGVPVQWWRSVGHSHNGFVVESFIDEVAHAAGKDPLAFRLSLLGKHPRHAGVLRLAAEKSGWGTPLPAGQGRGIAMHESFGSFIAWVAEVSADSEGKVRVHRMVCAVDCGRIVNPDTIAAQMESGAAFGLSATLYGAITLKNGKVEQGNFDTYPIVRMREMPRIEVHIVPSNEPPGGIGEPGVPPVASAVVNALYAATRVRFRSLPLTPQKVKEGLKAV